MLVNFNSDTTVVEMPHKGIPPDAPQLVFLVGLPGSGKTTWRHKTTLSAVRPCTVVSTDDLIEEWAALRSLNYSQAFREVDFGSIEAAMFGTFEDAVDHGRDVIIDRTNMRFKSRNRFVQRAGNHYRRIAALFELPDDVLSERLKTRGDATGKRIPQNVIDDMRRTYEPPDARQFHHVVRVTP